MKAAVFYGPHDFRVEEADEPKAGDYGIVVRVKVCGICGSDLHYYERGGPLAKPGRIMGHEFSGDVVEVGKQVKYIKVGDRVSAASIIVCQECYWCKAGQYSRCQNLKMGGFDFHGAYAEYASVPLAILDQTVFKLPDYISYEAGAVMEPLSVGAYSAGRAEPAAKDIVVIFGAGMIGLASLAASRAMGVAQIIVSDMSKKRLQTAREIGADIVIDAGSENVLQRVAQITDGRGADIAVECVGLRRPFLQALNVLRIDGKLMQVGVFDTPFEFNPVTITGKNLRVIGCLGGDYLTAMDLLKSGKVDAGKFITHEFPLKDIDAAFQKQLDSNESVKVLVRM
ncbi:MAG: alcohol dehydrogenase catalytic domain-containing protein [Dehalococcoidia bacterium]|nr:alcohol dehydrogenase catalytic domain-containing protein [Dehalococcoidia bacterium]